MKSVLGLRSAVRTRVPALWASWADCLPMILERHPAVAAQLIDQLEGHPVTPILRAASDSAHQLTGVREFVPPSWRALAHGARPETRELDQFEFGRSRDGWQHEVASRVEESFRGHGAVAAMRSQGGSGAGLALFCCPTCRITRLETQLFRVTLLRRLHLPLPLTSCRCGLPLDTTAQRAHAQGLWGKGDGLWRAWQVASAVKEVVE